MPSANDSPTKTTTFVRGVLAGCFFCLGLWLASDSGSSFLRGQVQETEKVIEVVASSPPPNTSNSYKSSIDKLDLGQHEDDNVPYRYCNGLEKVRTPKDFKDGFYMRYRCEGPEYDVFADHLHDFVLEEAPLHNPLWGKRGIPAGKTYLIIGSSHLQQVAQSLVCQEDQFGSGMVKIEYLDSVHQLVMVRYTFGNGAVVYHASNDWAIHMRQWPTYLYNQTGYPLNKFDAVIVGTTNSCNPPVKTNFAEDMKKLLTQRFGVECENSEGPPFHEYAKIFRQPLMYVNMFALYSQKRQEEDREEFLKVRHHYNPLYFEDARKYINKMGKGVWECGSVSLKQRFDCVNNKTATDKLHRCQGERGAHPDLVAWDIVEFMYGDYSEMESAPTIGDGRGLRHVF